MTREEFIREQIRAVGETIVKADEKARGLRSGPFVISFDIGQDHKGFSLILHFDNGELLETAYAL